MTAQTIDFIDEIRYWSIGGNGLGVSLYEMRLCMLAHIDATISQYSKTHSFAIKPLKYMWNVSRGIGLTAGERGVLARRWINPHEHSRR
jgi:hypothetical protein